MKKLHLNTYGDQKIHIHLVEELNNLDDARHVKAVGRTLMALSQNLATINPNAPTKQKLFFYNLLRTHTFKLIDENVNLKNEKVINFLKNIVIAKFRTYLKEIKES